VNIANPSIADTPQGPVSLKRYPHRSGDQNRAWNSADLLLLEYAAQSGLKSAQTLVVNDEFGALAIALGSEATSWSDSALAREALLRNAGLNEIEPPPLIPSTEAPQGRFGLVLLRVPKQLSLLRYQLQTLRDSLPDECLVVCGGMDKHLPRSLAAILEQYLGPTERHRGERKARLFSVRPDRTLVAREPEYQSYECAELGMEISSRPNVFSSGQLDIGTRLLLQQRPHFPPVKEVLDLGCGNGVIGLAALQQNPQANLGFVDESMLALASARDNVRRHFPEALPRCQFRWGDGLVDYAGAHPQLIICNPPFHQQHVVDDFHGRRLLVQSSDVLASGGELWLVANRHLPYARTLGQKFRSVERLAENAKFIVWRAVKG
jgi:16S rRNA G1207 methylase RsmC